METLHLASAPLISICMPAYNAGPYILQAIKSIQQQSYQNWELIVVNDGSTDNTAQELQSICDPRVHVFPQQNKGQCAAANKAFSMSKGHLIKFMDADDLLSDDFLKLQVAAINNADDSIAYSQWGRFYNNDLKSFKPAAGVITANMSPFDWLVASMQSSEVMLQCALWLIPRAILNKTGLWNEELSLINDFEFFIRVLLQAKQLRYAEEAILYYRSGVTDSLSSTNTQKGAMSAYQSTELGTGHLLHYSNTAEVRRLAADCFQRFVYTFYPDYPELVKQAERKVAELGGTAIPFPAGGYTRLVTNLLGWKMTKQIKKLLKTT